MLTSDEVDSSVASPAIRTRFSTSATASLTAFSIRCSARESAPSFEPPATGLATRFLVPTQPSVDREAVADPRHRVDVLRLLRVDLDLLAQPVDVSVDGSGLDVDVVAPNIAQQLRAAEDLARAGREQRQHVELGDGQDHLDVVAPDLAP